MARDVPDLASLLKYDFYPPPRDGVRGQGFDDEGPEEYSLLPHLYWHLTSSL